MNTVAFILLCLGIILFGLFIGLFLGILANIEEKKKKTDFFCEDNLIYGKFTDQEEVSIDEVVKRFKQEN